MWPALDQFSARAALLHPSGVRLRSARYARLRSASPRRGEDGGKKDKLQTAECTGFDGIRLGPIDIVESTWNPLASQSVFCPIAVAWRVSERSGMDATDDPTDQIDGGFQRKPCSKVVIQKISPQLYLSDGEFWTPDLGGARSFASGFEDLQEATRVQLQNFQVVPRG